MQEKSTDQIISEREKTHGDYSDCAATYNRIKKILHSTVDMPDELLLARDMIALKLARIASGDAGFLDHWADIAGYAQLAVDYLQSKKNAD